MKEQCPFTENLDCSFAKSCRESVEAHGKVKTAQLGECCVSGNWLDLKVVQLL